MIVADTTVWIDHFRTEGKALRSLLEDDQVAMHPFIVGELALGSLRERTKTLAFLDLLPRVRMAHDSEVRQLIETRFLYGQGIGLIDAQLIASVLISPATLLWTRDKRLRSVAERLGIDANLD